MTPFVLVISARRRKLVRASAIQEIVSLMALTPIDGAPGSCRGLANLRGETIPVFDPEGRDALLSPSRFILVARVDGAPVGLLVDDVHEVVVVPRDWLAAVPIGGGASVEAVRLGEDLVTVLDPADVVRHAS